MPRGGKRIYKQVGGEIEEEAARTGDTREDGGSGRLEGASEEERVPDTTTPPSNKRRRRHLVEVIEGASTRG